MKLTSNPFYQVDKNSKIFQIIVELVGIGKLFYNSKMNLWIYGSFSCPAAKEMAYKIQNSYKTIPELGEELELYLKKNISFDNPIIIELIKNQISILETKQNMIHYFLSHQRYF